MNKSFSFLGYFFLLYRPLPDAPRFGHVACTGGGFTLHTFYFDSLGLLWHKSVTTKKKA